MIQAIQMGQPIKYGIQNVQQSMGENTAVPAQNNITAPYSKIYANATRSLAFASMNINKTQNLSFKGQKLNDLPKTWFFDAEKQTIKDNYGVDYDLDSEEQKQKAEQSKKDFANFRETASKNIIPFYRFIPAGKLDPNKSSWMPDGYVAIKNSKEMEYFSWRELADYFED